MIDDKPLIIDVSANRSATKYQPLELLKRVLWGVGSLFFRFSPRICFGWRRNVLRLFGAKIGNNVHIYNSAKIYMPWNLEVGDWSCIGESALVYNLGIVKIGKYVTVSHKVHICAGTHDYSKPDFPLLKPPINIGASVWLCADCFIGPGVVVEEGAIVGARSVVTKSVSSFDIVAGNPAKKVGDRKMCSGV